MRAANILKLTIYDVTKVNEDNDSPIGGLLRMFLVISMPLHVMAVGSGVNPLELKIEVCTEVFFAKI